MIFLKNSKYIINNIFINININYILINILRNYLYINLIIIEIFESKKENEIKRNITHKESASN